MVTSLDVSAVAGHHAMPAALLLYLGSVFSSPGLSPGRAIVLPPASALAKCFYVKVFYVMGKALSGELSCPCDRSCCLWVHFSAIIRARLMILG